MLVSFLEQVNGLALIVRNDLLHSMIIIVAMPERIGLPLNLYVQVATVKELSLETN